MARGGCALFCQGKGTVILIECDVWRAECVAGITYDNDKEFMLYLCAGGEPVVYNYETREEAVAVYTATVNRWRKDLELLTLPVKGKR